MMKQKKLFPDFNNGWGASAVHEESQAISDAAHYAFEVSVTGFNDTEYKNNVYNNLINGKIEGKYFAKYDLNYIKEVNERNWNTINDVDKHPFGDLTLQVELLHNGKVNVEEFRQVLLDIEALVKRIHCGNFARIFHRVYKSLCDLSGKEGNEAEGNIPDAVPDMFIVIYRAIMDADVFGTIEIQPDVYCK